MIDAKTYLEHIERDGLRIPDAAEGHFQDAVPSCPGVNVETLLMHTGSLYIFWSEAIRQNRQPEIDWSALNTDLLAANREGVRSFVDFIGSKNPDEEVWTWADLMPGGSKEHVELLVSTSRSGARRAPMGLRECRRHGVRYRSRTRYGRSG